MPRTKKRKADASPLRTQPDATQLQNGTKLTYAYMNTSRGNSDLSAQLAVVTILSSSFEHHTDEKKGKKNGNKKRKKTQFVEGDLWYRCAAVPAIKGHASLDLQFYAINRQEKGMPLKGYGAWSYMEDWEVRNHVTPASRGAHGPVPELAEKPLSSKPGSIGYLKVFLKNSNTDFKTTKTTWNILCRAHIGNNRWHIAITYNQRSLVIGAGSTTIPNESWSWLRLTQAQPIPNRSFDFANRKRRIHGAQHVRHNLGGLLAEMGHTDRITNVRTLIHVPRSAAYNSPVPSPPSPGQQR